MNQLAVTYEVFEGSPEDPKLDCYIIDAEEVCFPPEPIPTASNSSLYIALLFLVAGVALIVYLVRNK